MMPVGKATIVDFLEWIRMTHPHVRSLSGLKEDEFMALATDYEASKTGSKPMRREDQLYSKWASAYYFFGQSSNDREALARYPR